jgi:hypothetical protein
MVFSIDDYNYRELTMKAIMQIMKEMRIQMCGCWVTCRYPDSLDALHEAKKVPLLDHPTVCVCWVLLRGPQKIARDFVNPRHQGTQILLGKAHEVITLLNKECVQLETSITAGRFDTCTCYTC